MEPSTTPAQHYKRPESVLVVIFTVEGRVLVLQRADDPDFWQSVTGSLDPGEEPADTAARELFEETGIDVGEPGIDLIDCQFSDSFIIREQWRYRYPPGTTRNKEHVFLARLATCQTIVLNNAEHLDSRWLTLNEAIDRCWSATNRQAIERFVAPRFAPSARSES